MKRSFLFLAVIATSASAQAPASLDSRLRASGDGWVAYDVPMVDDAGTPCCFDNDARRDKVCHLDGHSWNFGTHDHEPPRIGPATLTVYVHRHAGTPDRVRALASTCAVRADAPIARLGEVDADDSARWLQQWIAAPQAGKDAETAMGALAYQAGASATKALETLSEAKAPREQRKNALFWLGQTRGRDGAAVVERVARHDADADVREHAVFSLSQAKAIDGYAVIHDVAQHDAATQVRSQSLFWMAQTGDARAAKDIRAALREERDAGVREQAVFALSQLDSGADAALIEVLRSDAPREVKEKAMFWLGQSGSDEALRFLDGVLTVSEKKAR